MPSIDAVLFDLDGTLLDTAPDFINVVNAQRHRHGLEALAPERIRATVSNGARALIELSFGFGPDHADYVSRHTELLELYLGHLSVDTALFPGMDDLLQYLESRQIPWGIVTNKPRRYSEPLLRDLGLDSRCAVLVCPDDVTHRKPHPEPLLLACRTLDTTPAQTIYVGDHLRDIESGRAAGMPTVAVKYGYLANPDEADAWQADLVVETPEALIRWLRQRENRPHEQHSSN